MATVADVSQALDALNAAVQTSNDKTDQLIQAITDLRSQGGASPEDLDALLAQAQGTKVLVDEQIAQDDAALQG